MKIRIKKLLTEAKFDKLPPKRTKEQLATFILSSKYNIKVTKKLGEGAYGIVVEGISDEHGPVAIKILDSYAFSTQIEVENYRTVNSARNSSRYIKKHFPKVYHVDQSSNVTLIIMEILTAEEGLQSETISMLFGGINTAIGPQEDEQEVAKKHGLSFKSRENRYYMMFKDENSQNSIVQEFKDNMSPQLHYLETTMRNFFSYLDAYVSNKSYSQKKIEVLKNLRLSERAKKYLFSSGDTPKTIFKDAPWMMTFIIEQLEALNEIPDKIHFARFHEQLIMYWLEWFRQNSPIGISDGNKWAVTNYNRGAEPEQWAVFKEAISLKKAIMQLKDVTGLQARDLHDRNVMIRPLTGDIVIVDLGLFFDGKLR